MNEIEETCKILMNCKPEHIYFYDADPSKSKGAGIAEKDIFICGINHKIDEEDQIITVIHEAGHGVSKLRYKELLSSKPSVERRLDGIAKRIYKTDIDMKEFVRNNIRKADKTIIGGYGESVIYVIKLLNDFMRK